MAEDQGSERVKAISARWSGSAEQRSLTQKALQEGDLGLANTAQDLQKRAARLTRKGLDLEGIVESDDSLWSSFFSTGLVAARSVGRVVHAPNRKPVSPIGTGSLVTPYLLLTNNHVCADEETAREMAVQFDYEYDDLGSERSTDQRPLEPATFFLTDEKLDFTLVAVAPNKNRRPAGATYGYLPLIGVTGKAVMGEPLNVVHHPAGQRKKVSIRYNRMVAEDDLWIRYESDTEAGSSGAPVFNDQWEMVALHHGGIRRTNADEREITGSGAIWRPDMGEDARVYVGNEGARVSRIVTCIKETDLPAKQKRLVNVITEGEQ